MTGGAVTWGGSTSITRVTVEAIPRMEAALDTELLFSAAPPREGTRLPNTLLDATEAPSAVDALSSFPTRLLAAARTAGPSSPLAAPTVPGTTFPLESAFLLSCDEDSKGLGELATGIGRLAYRRPTDVKLVASA